ncbi:hypothetical protein [Streptosporangium sp. 'caverna']|uniref:hypothetical protein n=1 Tax=Streptosporangium sp. 'caverna' TaxID=2202249 RepID=UPI000D7DC689|nr:hypothetical protein [Streptosporangium sp. 'caverna']AWS48697.1 hypothetical protein DKM19_25460 [Streptosporangium sp. 'caverna']
MTHSVVARWTGAVLVAFLLTGCSPPQLGDRGGEDESPVDKISDVDYIEVFRNADNFPNVARICIEGLAFASTASTVANPVLLRMPEWDAKCVSHAKTPPPPG